MVTKSSPGVEWKHKTPTKGGGAVYEGVLRARGFTYPLKLAVSHDEKETRAALHVHWPDAKRTFHLEEGKPEEGMPERALVRNTEGKTIPRTPAHEKLFHQFHDETLRGTQNALDALRAGHGAKQQILDHEAISRALERLRPLVQKLRAP